MYNVHIEFNDIHELKAVGTWINEILCVCFYAFNRRLYVLIRYYKFCSTANIDISELGYKEGEYIS